MRERWSTYVSFAHVYINALGDLPAVRFLGPVENLVHHSRTSSHVELVHRRDLLLGACEGSAQAFERPRVQAQGRQRKIRLLFLPCSGFSEVIQDARKGGVR